MKSFKRFSKITLLVIFVLAIGFVLYIFISTGFFRTIENQFSGKVLKKVPLPGAEDITVSLTDGFALISSTDRAMYPPEGERQGGIYSIELTKGDFSLKHLSADFTKPFAPHGISLIKTKNTYKVMAINHTAKGHSIEVFTLENETLRYQETLTHPSMISPNDLVLIDDTRFYFTNDHGYTKGFGRFLEEYGGLSVSNVVYFDGENYREVANGIAYANGINFDKKRNLLFVASPRKFLIKVYETNTDGSLDFIEDIPCGTGVDNIEFDSKGNLWTAGHPNLLRFASYAKGRKETAPSEIIMIEYRSKGDYSVEQIYLEDGSTMSASSVAAPFKDLILAGNVMDDGFLVLKQGKKF